VDLVRVLGVTLPRADHDTDHNAGYRWVDGWMDGWIFESGDMIEKPCCCSDLCTTNLSFVAGF
jgi:hypothetical protein